MYKSNPRADTTGANVSLLLLCCGIIYRAEFLSMKYAQLTLTRKLIRIKPTGICSGMGNTQAFEFKDEDGPFQAVTSSAYMDVQWDDLVDLVDITREISRTPLRNGLSSQNYQNSVAKKQ